MTHSQALTLWQMLQCWQYLSCSFLHFFDGLSISFSVWQQNWTAVIQMRSNHTSIWQHKSGHCFFYWTGRTTPISFFSSHLNFLLVPCGRLSCLPISFYCTLNPHYRIVSYRIVRIVKFAVAIQHILLVLCCWFWFIGGMFDYLHCVMLWTVSGSITMKIAVEGCCHGELDKIYETLEYIEHQDNIKVDLLLICGDFQVT